MPRRVAPVESKAPHLTRDSSARWRISGDFWSIVGLRAIARASRNSFSVAQFSMICEGSSTKSQATRTPESDSTSTSLRR